MGLTHGVDLPGQIAINIEIQRGLEQARSRNRELEAQQPDNTPLESEKDMLDALKIKNDALSHEVHSLYSQNNEKKALIEKQKTLLREWMLSQRSFRNLLHKHGKLPDGRSFADLSKEERESIVVSEERHIEQTGDGISSDNHALRKIIMGK